MLYNAAAAARQMWVEIQEIQKKKHDSGKTASIRIASEKIFSSQPPSFTRMLQVGGFSDHSLLHISSSFTLDTSPPLVPETFGFCGLDIP